MPQILRDSPLNSIWEGSDCELAAGADRRLDARLDRIKGAPAELFSGEPQFVARRYVEDLAVAFQASLLVRHAPPAVSDAFCAARRGENGRVYANHRL